MKTKWLILVAVLLGIGLGLWLFHAQASEVQFAWEYDYGTDPACSSTLTTDCVSEFELYRLNPDGSRTLLEKVANPASPSGLMTVTSPVMQVGPPYGSQDFFAIAVGLDGAGARVESVPSNVVTEMIRPTKPQNLRSQ